MTAISDYGTIDFMKMNAQLSNDLLDTPYQFVPKLTHYAEAHIEDCKQNPTIGLLARQHVKTNDYPNMARENMALLRQQDSFEKVDNEFKQVFSTLKIIYKLKKLKFKIKTYIFNINGF